ncbi:MAG: hypothetical protein PUC37_11325 [Spirochaetales bacterium]|nr:hypothetical protein [Spirochaetales bacterium]
MKKKQKYFNLETYDYTPYARELTEEEMYLVNGGRQMKSDRTNDSEYVSSRPNPSTGDDKETSSQTASKTQSTSGSFQGTSSSQQNSTLQSQDTDTSKPTCTAAEIAAAKGKALNEYFDAQDKKREENKKVIQQRSLDIINDIFHGSDKDFPDAINQYGIYYRRWDYNAW